MASLSPYFRSVIFLSVPLAVLTGCGGGSANFTPTKSESTSAYTATPPASTISASTISASTISSSTISSSTISSSTISSSTRDSSLDISASSSKTRIRLACIGDSITVGVGTTNYEAKSYPSVLAKKLGSAYEVRNFGVSGAAAIDTASVPYRRQTALKNALAFKPAVVVIGLGSNDSALPVSTIRARFVKNYLSLIGDLKRAKANVRVFVCLPPAFNPPSRGKTLMDEILPKIPQIAKSGKAQVINLYAPLSNAPSRYSDSVHPNDAGAAILAEAVFRAVKSK